MMALYQRKRRGIKGISPQGREEKKEVKKKEGKSGNLGVRVTPTARKKTKEMGSECF